jgi:hypothetical protein
VATAIGPMPAMSAALIGASLRVKNRGGTNGSTGGGSGGGGDTGGSEKGAKKCSDGVDNDGDGLIDAADPDCQ